MPSEKVLESKKAKVAALSEKLKGAAAGVIVDYKGITVEDDTKLRSEFRKAGVEYAVVKNSLLRFALKDAGLDGLDNVLEGTTALAISKEDLVAPAKVFSEFAKDKEFLKAKAGFVEGKAIGVDEVEALAKLPAKEVLIAKVLGGFNAPISGLANVLNANLRGLVVALNAIAEKQSA